MNSDRCGTASGLSIKQTADLYGVTIDTLYYYENIGLVVPNRDEANGYRRYTEKDFAVLNVIESMRGMDLSLGQAKSYLGSHTLDTNIELLRAELGNLNTLLECLRERQKGVESALIRYTQALLEVPKERIKDIWFPERPILSLGAMPDSERSLPYLMARRLKEVGIPLNVFHIQPTFTITTTVNESGTFDGIEAFLYSESGLGAEDRFLPEGRYLTLTSRGSALETPGNWKMLERYMREHQLESLGDPLEFWTVNEYISDDENEFIRTIQVRVKEMGDSSN